MATISVQDVAKAVNTWLANNKKVVRADMAQALTVELDKHTKKITKVKGNFPQFHSIISHVVQGFKAQWQALGEAQFKHKVLKNYHQKVNFEIIPSEILGTWLADMYEEGKTPTNKEIAKHIIKSLLAKVQDDLNYLSIKGVYDAANADGQFGKSLNGIEKVVELILADATHPAYKIPINTFTDNNIVAELTLWERKLPAFFKMKVKKVFMSVNNVERYLLDYEDKYGQNTDYRKGDALKTKLGKREIIGLEGLADDVVFGAPEGVLAKLIDVIDNPPKITDVQIQDYKIKIFMEFWLGYDFLLNESVMVANFTDGVIGLGTNELMESYYPNEDITYV